MTHNPTELRRRVYFDPDMKEFVAIAYYESPERILIMAVKRHKQKSMSVQMAMRAAKERTIAGEFGEVTP